jgi:hypothetical protein
VVCHFSLAARSQKAFETAVEQYPKARIRLRNRAPARAEGSCLKPLRGWK